MVQFNCQRITFLTILVLFVSNLAFSDQIDTLKFTLHKAKTDSAKSSIYTDIAYYYLATSIDSSLWAGKNALLNALSSKDTLLHLQALNVLGQAYWRKTKYDSSILHFEKAIEIAKSQNFERALAVFYNNLGGIYKSKGDPQTAINFYLRGLKVDEARENKSGIASKYTNIARIYFQMKDYENSIRYDSMAINLKLELENEESLALSYNNIGITYQEIGNTKLSEAYYLKALELNKKTKNNLEASRNLNNLGILMSEIGQILKALKYNLEALDMRIQIGDKYGIAESYMSVADNYSSLGKLKIAEQYLIRCDSVVQLIREPYLTMELYKYKANIYKANDAFSDAYSNMNIYYQIKDSLETIEKQKQINELLLEYETEKKDKTILGQKIQMATQNEIVNRQRVYLLSAIIFILLLASGLIIYYLRKKSLEQKLLVIEEQKKADNLRHLMIGEEKERSRLAQELHDGVNGSLAAIRMVVNGFNKTNNGEIVRIGNMIDEVSDEVREISHNLLPGSLNKIGLTETIEEFIRKINIKESIKINFVHFGEFEHLSDFLKLSIYRIIQELLKNVISHSKATECMIQLISQNNEITITVEDNGIGYEDKQQSVKNSGIGLRNIESRVNLANGKLDIVSEKGVGTSFNIEIPV